MIIVLDSPVKYKPSWIDSNANHIVVTMLTIKQIIDDPLLKKVSVAFFEAPTPLVLWEEQEYNDNSTWTDQSVKEKAEEIIKKDKEKAAQAIFETNSEKLKEENALRVVAVNELKKQFIQQYPSLFQQAKNLTTSLTNWVKDGVKVVSEEVLNQRMDICKKCEFWDSEAFAGTGRCSKCGCSTQAKLRMATEKCPIDKW
jgi:hypothetical protein